MKLWAIGDVHGAFTAMETLLDFAPIKAQDQVIWLGDYVGRGPDSALVIEKLLQLNPQQHFFLRGNHEIMMERCKTSLEDSRRWAGVGGAEAWDSYQKERADCWGWEAVPESHWEFLSRLLPYLETQEHIFVHASLESHLPLDQQHEYSLFWEFFDLIKPHCSGKHIICAHSTQENGIPKALNYATCIDTWACGEGWLTCLDVKTGKYYQANQAGQTRTGLLELSS